MSQPQEFAEFSQHRLDVGENDDEIFPNYEEDDDDEADIAAVQQRPVKRKNRTKSHTTPSPKDKDRSPIADSKLRPKSQLVLTTKKNEPEAPPKRVIATKSATSTPVQEKTRPISSPTPPKGKDVPQAELADWQRKVLARKKPDEGKLVSGEPTSVADIGTGEEVEDRSLALVCL